MYLLDRNSQTRILSVFEGAIYNGFFLITQGFLGTGLALEFGASEPVIALIGVLPSVSQLIQLIAPFILRLVGNRKKVMMICASAGRLSTAFIPVTLALGINRQSLLLIILAFFSFAASFAGNFWVSIIRDVVPPDKSARFFSLRNVIFTITNMLITLLYSFILDHSSGKTGFVIITTMGQSVRWSALFYWVFTTILHTR